MQTTKNGYYIRSRKLKTCRYTDKEKDFIRDNYQNITDQEIGIYLNRNPRGVEGQRYRMELVKGSGNWIENYNQQRERIREITALYNYQQQGKGGTIITQRLKVLGSQPAFKQVLYSNSKYYTLRKKALAYELFISGMSYKEVGYAMALSPTTVNRWIKKFRPYTGENTLTISIMSRC